ncbi:unnamed protein product, partial [Rotaria sp. Silwood1]
NLYRTPSSPGGCCFVTRACPAPDNYYYGATCDIDRGGCGGDDATVGVCFTSGNCFCNCNGCGYPYGCP